MIYSPELFDRNIRIPYFTSHIDIAPTLLFLTGIPTEGLIYHGMNMLDQRISDRITFLMNTGLSPVDGYHWHNYYFTYNELTGNTHIATQKDRSDIKMIGEVDFDIPIHLLDVGDTVRKAHDSIQNINASFLHKRGER